MKTTIEQNILNKTALMKMLVRFGKSSVYITCLQSDCVDYTKPGSEITGRVVNGLWTDETKLLYDKSHQLYEDGPKTMVKA